MEFKIFRALGLAFRSLFRNFVPFVLLTVLLYAPVVIWVATLDYTDVATLDELLDKVFIWPIYAITAVATLLAPMLTYRVVQDLNGVKVSMMTSIKHGVRGFVPALIVAAIVNVLQAIPFGGIVGTVLMCIWFVAAPAAVAEKLGPFAALSRSAQLTSGRRWGIFGLTFLIGILLIVLMVAWIVPMLEGDDAAYLDNLRSSSIIFVSLIGVFHMFTGIVEAVSYALLRQDKDGVSHEQLARVFE